MSTFFFPNFLDCRFPQKHHWVFRTGKPSSLLNLAVEAIGCDGVTPGFGFTLTGPGSGGWDTAKRSGKPMPQALKQLENENFKKKKHQGFHRISHVTRSVFRGLTRCLGPLQVTCKLPPSETINGGCNKIPDMAHLSTLESPNISPHFLK